MPAFKLIPFPAEELPKINITGEIERKDNHLSIHYQISGEIDQILFPAQSASPSRKDDLWKATCFEFFIAIEDRPQYWEFNMSPSSDWNVYVMDAYRQVNMREETEFTELPFDFKVTNEIISLNMSVDLNSITQPKMDIDIGVTAIIQTKDGQETYWALSHPSQQADFHQRESFSLAL